MSKIVVIQVIGSGVRHVDGGARTGMSRTHAVRATLAATAIASLYGCSSGDDSVTARTTALTVPLPPVTQFVVLASRSASFNDRTFVTGGHVGVAAGTGNTLAAGFDTRIGVGQVLLAPKVTLNEGATTGEIGATAIAAPPSAVTGPRSGFLAPPVQPVPGTVSPGANPITVGAGQTVNLAAGAFGAVTVNGTLNLSGGLYQFQSLRVNNDARLMAQATSTVRVAGVLTALDRARLLTAAPLPPSALRLVVAGATDALVLGNDVQLTALVVARGDFHAGDRLVAAGAVAARDVVVGHDSRLAFAAGFGCGSNVSCDDGNACTTDSCVDAQCARPPVPNGTACSDGNACTRTDSCQGGACVGTNPVVCSASDQCHVAGVCNKATAVCSNPTSAEGTTCNDGNGCTQTYRCLAGACVGGNPIVCAATDCQVAATCSAATGTCPAPTAEADGSSCQIGGHIPGQCQAGVCQAAITAFSLTLQGGGVSPTDPTLLYSQFDNPELMGTDTLQTIAFNGKSFPEHADGTVLPGEWAYENFNLVVRATGDDTLGARTINVPGTELITQPAMMSIFDPPATMPFTARGLQLGYATSTVTTVHEQIDNTPRTPDSVRAQLDPTVMLVPIQIVKVVPPATATFVDELKNITVAERNRLFDDRVPIDIFSVSHPDGEVNVFRDFQVASTNAGARTLSFTEPDLVWAQCGIQFRVVSCGGADDPGAEQCPDLNVTTGINVSGNGVQCNISPEARLLPDFNSCGCEDIIAHHNRDDARMLPGVRADLPLVLLTGRVANPQCGLATIVDLAETGVAYMGVFNQDFDTKLVLAHELGHVLGLNHDDSQPNVMNSFTAQAAPLIPQSLCQAARTQAAVYVKAKWGITIDPGVWIPTPPATR
jgi:hypothetical protein